jgi:hypothetical protein
MTFSNRYLVILFAIFFAVSGATFFTARLRAQDDGWQIVRADYGYKSQRNDVTDVLKDLVARGGVNGRIVVNNQTMGGDPAKGKDKSLHITARNRKQEEREFSFNENDYVDARMFTVRRDGWDDRSANSNYGRDQEGPNSSATVRRDDRDDRPVNYDRDRDSYSGLSIVRAYYGVQGKTINVTDLLRSFIREGTLTVLVTNSAMGGDPAVGSDKVLIVVYRYQGVETAAAIPEGNTLALP